MNKFKVLISILVLIFSIEVINAQAPPPPTPPPPPPSVRTNDVYSKPKIPSNSTVRARIFYAETGRAVKRTVVMLMAEDGSGGPSSSSSGVTDEQGYVEIKKVKAGTYYAMVNAPGVVSPLAYTNLSRANRGRQQQDIKKAFEGFEKIVVDGISDVDVQIRAIRGGAIGGRVMYDDGDPAIGVKVEVLRKVDEKFVPVISNFSTIISMFSGMGFRTDDRGMYRFSGLPAGDYIIKVTESASHTNSKVTPYRSPEALLFAGNSFLSIFFPNVFDSESAETINVQLGQEFSEANIIIPSRSLYQIEGKLISKKDKSPVKGRIAIKRVNEQNLFSFFSEFARGQGSELTDENGNWKFKELPKGKYKLIVEPIDNQNYFAIKGDAINANRVAKINNANNSVPTPQFSKQVKEITIEDQSLNEIVIEMTYGAKMSGTVYTENSKDMPQRVNVNVVNENGELITREYVSNYAYRDSKSRARRQSETKSHKFQIENIPHGKNTLMVDTTDDGFYLKSATYKGKDLLAQKFELKEGDDLKGVKIILGNDVGTLKGKLLDEDGKPLKNEDFALVPTDAVKRKNPSFYKSVTTNSNGEFETNLAPLEYAVVFFEKANSEKANFDKWLDEATKDAKKVKIESGKTETITINTVSEEN